MAITCSLSKKALLQEAADVYVLFVTSGFKSSELKSFTQLYPALPKIIEQQKFTGNTAELVSVPMEYDGRLIYLLVVGLGKKNKTVPVESYRRALATVIRFIQKNKLSHAALQVPTPTLFGVNEEYLAEQTAIIAHMTDYIFDTYKKVDDRKPLAITLCADESHVSGFKISVLKKSLEQGAIIGAAVNAAREWVNTPANALYPEALAAHAQQLARTHKLQFRIFNQEEIHAMKMGGLLAVGSGSDRDPRLVILEYKTTKKNAPTLAFVGKGITFDSGGLSLKPASGMETMKEDMSGAAAVIATMGVLAQLKPDVNVVAITPLAENLPGGSATKPGDIVRMYNGLTVEIKNTDAEGRLILADALAYVISQYKPAAVVDIATLTGACSRALGPFFTGLFTEHENLKEKVFAAADIMGEPVWRLPLTDDYKKSMDGVVSDLRNTAQPYYLAGATTAAVFLQKFVGDTPWVHLDIGGTAFDVPNLPYQRKETATGVGVRLLTHLAREWKS